MLTPSDVMGELAPAYPLSGGGPTQRAPRRIGIDTRMSRLRPHAETIAVERLRGWMIPRQFTARRPADDARLPADHHSVGPITTQLE